MLQQESAPAAVFVCLLPSIAVTIVAMTVCIALLADRGTKAVLVADRMLTTPGLLPYSSDNAAEKILKINDSVHVMWAGGLADAANILSSAKTNIGTRKLSVQEIAEQLRLAHLKYLLDLLENQHVKGRGIQDLAAFYGDKTINLSSVARGEVEQALATYNLLSNTQFIVCGKDDDGQYKIFMLNTNPRLTVMLAMAGWATIGSAFLHAQYAITHSDFDLNLPVDQVRTIAEMAKKKAEKDPGVGKDTDIVELA